MTLSPPSIYQSINPSRIPLTTIPPMHRRPIPLPRLRPNHISHTLKRIIKTPLVEFSRHLNALPRIISGPYINNLARSSPHNTFSTFII